MPDYMQEFDDDFEFKDLPDESTPHNAENMDRSLKNTRLLKRFINDVITGKVDLTVGNIKSKNLIWNNQKKTVESNGITFTYNEDGTYTINGKNNGNGNSLCYIWDNTDEKFRLKLKGRYYQIPNQNENISIIWNYNEFYRNHSAQSIINFNEETIIKMCYIQIPKGNETVFDNEKLYLMLSTDPDAITPDKYVKHIDF